MRICTWFECTRDAEHPQLDKAGKQWADLCGVHDAELSGAVADNNVKRMLSGWVKASGGSKKLTEKM